MRPSGHEPTYGAGRREGVLLGAYALLLIVGVWTVVVSELGTQEPASVGSESVTSPTQKSR